MISNRRDREGVGGKMDDRCWYEAEALMPDLTSHRHEILGASEGDVRL